MACANLNVRIMINTCKGRQKYFTKGNKQDWILTDIITSIMHTTRRNIKIPIPIRRLGSSFPASSSMLVRVEFTAFTVKKNPYSWKSMLPYQKPFLGFRPFGNSFNGFPNRSETQKGFQIVTNTFFFYSVDV